MAEDKPFFGITYISHGRMQGVAGDSGRYVEACVAKRIIKKKEEEIANLTLSKMRMRNCFNCSNFPNGWEPDENQQMFPCKEHGYQRGFEACSSWGEKS